MSPLASFRRAQSGDGSLQNQTAFPLFRGSQCGEQSTSAQEVFCKVASPMMVTETISTIRYCSTPHPKSAKRCSLNWNLSG
jgi:hypothetical protein